MDADQPAEGRLIRRSLQISFACLLPLLPGVASAKALAREGIVAILPSATFSSTPASMESREVAAGGTVAFGFKPSASLEVGIDIGASTSAANPAVGKGVRILSAPILLRLSWTPVPQWEVRPVFHLGAGKALITVDGPSSYEEHTPNAIQATAGIQADLSSTIGLWSDAGYLYARATDPRFGAIDGGGIVARAGVYFRWEPVPERGFNR